MAHAACHDEGRDRGGKAQHHEGGDELLAGVAERHRAGHEDGGHAHELHERAHERGHAHRQGAPRVEACPQRDEAQRRGEASHLADRGVHDAGQGQAQRRPRGTRKDRQDQRVGRDLVQRLAQQLARDAALAGTHELEDDDGHDVVDGCGADDHERRGAGVAVDVLHEGHAQKRRRRAELRLHGLAAPVGPAECQRDDVADRDAREGGERAEGDEAAVPHLTDVHGRQVVEEKRGQGDAEHERVGEARELVGHQAAMSQAVAHDHHEEDGHRCVEAEYQFVHVTDGPSLQGFARR